VGALYSDTAPDKSGQSCQYLAEGPEVVDRVVAGLPAAPRLHPDRLDGAPANRSITWARSIHADQSLEISDRDQTWPGATIRRCRRWQGEWCVKRYDHLPGDARLKLQIILVRALPKEGPTKRSS
jgi:hypothetical protein